MIHIFGNIFKLSKRINLLFTRMACFTNLFFGIARRKYLKIKNIDIYFTSHFSLPIVLDHLISVSTFIGAYFSKFEQELKVKVIGEAEWKGSLKINFN